MRGCAFRLRVESPLLVPEEACAFHDKPSLRRAMIAFWPRFRSTPAVRSIFTLNLEIYLWVCPRLRTVSADLYINRERERERERYAKTLCFASGA